MGLPESVSEHYLRQQRLIVATLGLVRGEWSKMGADFDASWANIAPRVELITASAQLGAARNGASYVPRTLAGYGEAISSLADVDPRAFAGIASDGRPLGSLLEGAKAHAKQMNSLEAGGKWLDMAVHTQIADASRGAAAVSIATRPGVGYVRMVNPPCCGPCAVLAGHEYRYNQGFKRHPRCDCVHIPTTLANPGDHFGVNPTLDQITDLTESERKALIEGSDLSRVINARRGASRDRLTTTALARRGQARLTPDGIFARAKSRDEALRLLRQNGYITPTARKVAATARPAVKKVPALRRFDPDNPSRGFSTAEAEAFKDYQGTWYHDINGPLRSGAPLEPRAQEIASTLDSAISKSAIDAETVVFRGLYERPSGLESAAEFVDNGFSSTSLNEDFVRRIFAEGEDAFVMRITLPRGTNAVRLDTSRNLPDFFQEDEILLGRGSRFRVLSETKGAPGEPTVLEVELIR